ncbi:hypothetical protein [Streptomyces sp. NPDC003077]|uniref:hypothetical protein n=1 Tax=Streptomyces sp. NPDC003077 TaxID=3154443 RepID=UPI0033BD1E90
MSTSSTPHEPAPGSLAGPPTDRPAEETAVAGTDDPYAVPVRSLRVFAGLGFLALAVAWVLSLVISLHQAYSGDGASGPLLEAGQWAMGFSLPVGLLALSLPTGMLGRAGRRNLVLAQYALVVAGPVLIAVD